MKIILLSGGSGKRLWPLSNEARSKQFLQLLSSPNGGCESMVQRIARQVSQSKLHAEVVVATSLCQYDSIVKQLGAAVEIITEPMRRDTFPAIALSASYLSYLRACPRDEVIVVMPSDSYVDGGYFDSIASMAKAVEDGVADILLMGVSPSEPSEKFGYILPGAAKGSAVEVRSFVEKPSEGVARELLTQGALWNGGVFAFKLGYMVDLLERYIDVSSFEELRSRYGELPRISFDYQVVQRAESVAYVPYCGEWSDLGTWDSLVQRLEVNSVGDAIVGEGCIDTHVINYTHLPIISLGLDGVVVAASADGILVASRQASVALKSYADEIDLPPMYEEFVWGSSRSLHCGDLTNGVARRTILLSVDGGSTCSRQSESAGGETLTVVEGRGVLILADESRELEVGDICKVNSGERYSLEARDDMQVVLVQIP